MTASSESAAALRPADAARYLGISKFTLRNIRQGDRRAVALGEPTRGPKFIVVSRSVCLYRREDLDAWLEQQAQATEESLRPKRVSKQQGR